MKAKTLAETLLASQSDPVPLHGDLHHDNVRLGLRGFCAFGAKGVLGERAFELANGFRNPKGLEPLHRSVERVRFLADFWSREFTVSRPRLLGWAAANCALAIAARSAGTLHLDQELDLLAVLLHVAAEHPLD
jgi:streptomycin 6-kinase